MFWSVGWPLLRAQGFFYNLDILYGGLGTGKLQFLLKKNFNKFSAVIFFQFLVMKSWIRIESGSGLVVILRCWIRIRIRKKWIRIRNPVNTGTHVHSSIVTGGAGRPGRPVPPPRPAQSQSAPGSRPAPPAPPSYNIQVLINSSMSCCGSD